MIGARPLSSSSNSSPFDTTTIRNSIGGGSGGRISFSSSNSNSSSSNNNNRALIDDENDEEFNQKLSSSTPLENHTISKFSKTSSSWFNPVTTIQSLINYSLFLVVVSQLICPVLLPLVLSSFLEKQQPDGNGAVDHFVVSFSVGFENDKRLVTNVNLSATKMIYLLQWLIHIPLVILPYISLIVNKSYVRESRMMVYWFCILSLFLSNVVVSLKQASFDWISFIPSILESTDISWGGEKIVFNRSIPFIKKQLETSSILPQLLSLLLFTTITLYFIRDVIFGLNVNFRGRDEIVGLREFIEREFSICLVSPLQAMLKLTSIDSNLESINHTTIIPQQPIVSQKEVTQNVPSNKDMQSPSSPTEVNVTPSVETNESPRLALSIYNTTAKQPMTVKKTVILDKQNKDKEESDDSDWGVDSDDDEEIKKNTKFSHLAEAKEKMITKSDKKTENEASHSPSPSSDLPSVSMVITNSVHTAESKPHSILHSNTSPTTGTTVTTGAPKVIGGNFMKKRFSGRSTPETGCDEYQSSLQAVYNKNRNSKLITEPLDLEESKEANNEVEKPKTSEERRKVSFDD